MVLSTSSANLRYSNRPLRRLPYPWFKLKFHFAVIDPHSDRASFKGCLIFRYLPIDMPCCIADLPFSTLRHRSAGTPIPRCSSNHCLDSVGFICPRTNKNHGNVFQEYIPITVSLRFLFGVSEPKHPDEDKQLSPEPSMPTHWWQHNQWDSNPQSPTRKVGALNQFGYGCKI